MNLIIVFLSLVLERVIGNIDESRRTDWFDDYVAWVYRHLNFGGILFRPVGPLVILGPLLLLAQLLTAMVQEGFFGLLSIAFGVVVLLYCYGPRDLERDVDDFLEALTRNDLERAREIARHFSVNGDDEERPKGQVLEGILVEANSRIFGVIIWFLLLGPLGAVLYRGACLLLAVEDAANRPSAIWAMRLLGILDWLPVRLLALGYAVMGAFDGAFSRLRRDVLSVEEPLYERNRLLLREAGIEALQVDRQWEQSREDPEAPFRAALSLATRAVVGWLVLLALVMVLVSAI